MPAQGKGKRLPVDWEKVEAEYRAGQLSVREIARACGVDEKAIRNRAAKCGWERALADKVRQTVKERLVRSESPQGQRTSDADIIEAASLRGLAVVTSHRVDLQQLHALKRIILTRLAAHLNGDPIEGPFMGDKETPGDLVEKLSRVTSRLIPLERQAHNLDDDSGKVSGKIEVSADDAFAELVGKLEGVARSATANNPAPNGLAGDSEA